MQQKKLKTHETLYIDLELCSLLYTKTGSGVYRSKRYEEQGDRLTVGDGWIEKRGRRKRGRIGGRAIDIDRKREREKERGRERERIVGKKNQANWYAAHNNRRVERRGSEVRPELGVPAPGERVGSILSLSLVFSSTAGTYAVEEKRARRHASAYMHARFSPVVVRLLFLFSFLASFIGRLRAAARGKSRNTRETEQEAQERKERK